MEYLERVHNIKPKRMSFDEIISGYRKSDSKKYKRQSQILDQMAEALGESIILIEHYVNILPLDHKWKQALTAYEKMKGK